ncbi:MAG TPA: HAD family phosphatase [Nitrospirota bacterium]|nr:HAD family phosphatase [Nitrospirota bacterium]
MTTKIATLFLDIGGVLLTNGWGRASRKSAAEHFKLDFAEMDERHHLTFDTYESGKLGLDEYLNRVVFHEARPFSREDFKTFMFDQSQPYPEMIELIIKLKARYGIKTAAVNNEGRELSLYRIRKFALDTFIDFFITSCYVRLRKPDADIYHLALDIANASPAGTLYIDDRLLFVEVARGLGLESIHHKAFETTRTALESYGLSV